MQRRQTTTRGFILKPLFMHFPSKLDENIDLLAKNNRFSEIEKGTLLLHDLSVHDEYSDEERKYGEAVAAGWLNQSDGHLSIEDQYPDVPPKYHALIEQHRVNNG